jgi:hypothetical protein
MGAVNKRTSTGPVYYGRWITICRTCEVCERSEVIDLFGVERGDVLAFDSVRCSIDKLDGGDSKERQ